MTEKLPGWRHVAAGKVRDLYVPETPGQDTVLLVASDRISAYDAVLSPEIPDKGRVLTALTLWWLERLDDLIPHHVISADDVPAPVRGRALLCRRLDMLPLEAVVRGYLAGSGLAEYRVDGKVGGHSLPPDLVTASALPSPIFTPARKAPQGEHDENITVAQARELLGSETADAVEAASLAIYERAAKLSKERGLLLADTKFEYGINPENGALTLGDEVLTPDSSRFWLASEHRPGRSPASFDKQYVRDWLTSPASGWDKNGRERPPRLPERVVAATRDRYLDAYRRLTGHSLP
ncbi:phosphoribosylaminoimidazolesuccinocarboxamide synthase [Dermabacteraceae bacterium P13077]